MRYENYKRNYIHLLTLNNIYLTLNLHFLFRV